jgi:type I restriction enzyme S subunit
MSTNPQTVSLREIAELISTQVDPRDQPQALYIGLEHVGSSRFIRSGGGVASDVQSSKFAFRQGDVLYGKLRPYLDKAILAERDGVCTTELLVLRAKDGIDPRFLIGVVHCREFIAYAISGTTGSQHPRTSWHRISEFELPAFSPEERAKIADIIWTAHNSLLACEEAIESGEQLKSAAMRDIFTRGLRGEPQKETEIGPVPESWDVVPLGSLGRVGNGSTPKKTIPEYWTGGTYPWLTSAKVYDREIVEADQFVTDVALRECHLPRVEPGAILIAITGQGKTLGHCAVLRMQATINQHIAYVATDTSRANPSFVRGYLETQYDYLRQVGSGGGSTKGALTCAFLRSMPIPFPPLHEQREIVEILDVIDRKIDLHQRKRTVLEDLFKSLLQKLMTGEIRVADLDLSALGKAPLDGVAV